jgi:hypothetical protein
MAEQLESKTAIMLDQAQVDAAEAAADAQENGENGEHIGRRPSSSGRDSKRHRKSSFVCRCHCHTIFSLFLPLHGGRTRLPADTTAVSINIHQQFCLHFNSLTLPSFLPSISSCCTTSSDAIKSTPTQPNT